MKIRQILTLIATLGLSAVFALHSHASDFPKGSPDFASSYDEALKAAKEGDKPVVLVFSASWCPPCQANKQNVYPSAQVKPFHDKFVWAYLDADQEANMPAMQKFSVSGIPHIQFLNKNGASLGNVVGGTSPQEFAATLTQILAKTGRAPSGGSGFKDGSLKN